MKAFSRSLQDLYNILGLISKISWAALDIRRNPYSSRSQREAGDVCIDYKEAWHTTHTHDEMMTDDHEDAAANELLHESGKCFENVLTNSTQKTWLLFFVTRLTHEKWWRGGIKVVKGGFVVGFNR